MCAAARTASVPPETSEGWVMIGYRAMPSYYRWAKGLAEASGLPITSTIDLALKKHAESIGYRQPPSRIPPRKSRARVCAG